MSKRVSEIKKFLDYYRSLSEDAKAVVRPLVLDELRGKKAQESKRKQGNKPKTVTEAKMGEAGL